jgi:hypothetical protein
MTIKPCKGNVDTREKLFYLFLIAQICAIFCMIVGVLFFILRILRVV